MIKRSPGVSRRAGLASKSRGIIVCGGLWGRQTQTTEGLMSRTHFLFVVVSALIGAGCSSSTGPVARATPSAVPTTAPIVAASAKTQAPAEPVAAPAAFNTAAAATQPAVELPQTDVADAFDAQLQRLITGETQPDASAIS